ncbi:MAG: ABC transporter substrate-binding protein [Bdellovibrionaceae bacterium]|nr:ABC transporter substrate-binding protein [Pseudobdellovibrionaceae bacterium]
MKNKHFLFLIISINLLSCQNSTPPFNKHIKVGIEQKIKTLNPLKATAALDMRLNDLLFSSLVRLDKNLRVVGDLAKSWTYKNNTYTFLLKDNIRFSNGRPLTKEDLLFSFQAFKDPKCIFHHAFSVIKKISVHKNKKTQRWLVKLFLKKSSAKFLRADLPVLKILPKQEFLKNKNLFNQKPIGTGSYYINTIKPNAIDLKPNPHSLEPGKTALLFKVVSDNTTRYQKLLKQDIDISFNNTETIKVKALQKNLNFKIHTSPGLSVTYLLLNLKHPLLSKISVRKALQSSLNIKKIIQYKLQGLATPAKSLLHPKHLFFNTYLKTTNFDLKKAKDFLHSIDLKPLTLKVSNKPSSINFGKILTQQIKQSGIPVTVKSLEWGVLYKDLKNTNFDIALMSWSGVIDPDIYRIAFHSSEWPPGRNRSLYKNKILDKLLEQGIYTLNLAQRKKIYNKVQSIIAQDVAVIPLWHKKQTIISHKSILGLSPSLTESFSPLKKVYKATNLKAP